MGGVGKTSLAVEYAHRYRHFYAGVWWCPSESRVGLLTALASLSVELGAVAADEPDLEKAAKARLKAMPGFALPYDLIPSKDREFQAAPHYRSN
jgi:hypothetical protein